MATEKEGQREKEIERVREENNIYSESNKEKSQNRKEGCLKTRRYLPNHEDLRRDNRDNKTH